MPHRISRIGFGMIAAGMLFLLTAGLQEGRAERMFSLYRSEHAQLPVSFEYPAEWQVEYSSGTAEAYAQVQMYGPAALDTRLRTYIVVRVVPPKAQGGRYAGVGEMVAAYQTTLLPGLRVDQDRQIVVLDSPATILDISGMLNLPWEVSRAPKPVPVKSQRVFLEKNGWLYELSWLTTPEASQQVERAFSHLLSTLVLSR